MTNRSPWLDQLPSRPAFPIAYQDFYTDITIVWWWIAGISSLYYILKNTDKKVTLLEGYKVAHGATWHNAWQIVPYFEKPFVEIVEEFGISLANQWQQDMLDARERIQELVAIADMEDVFEKFIWYAWYCNIEQIIENLQKNHIQEIHHIQYESILISEDCLDRSKIPSIYEDMIEVVPQKKINALLETKGNKYIGVMARPAWTINSALFCEKMINYLVKTYHDRFQIYEFSPVEKIDLYKNKCTISVKIWEKKNYAHISTKKVVLCTNGFEHFDIINHAWPEINDTFHKEVEGLIGYMSWYLDKKDQSPKAISYYLQNGELDAANEVENYFYLTRRQFKKHNKDQSLICIWWPESIIHETQEYIRHEAQPDRAHNQMDNFLQKTFQPYPKKKIQYQYRRHGLMWFTKSWIRIVWPDKKNERLLYNLWCNGVGILSSIYGWQKIAKILQWEKLPKSIFDPQ